MAKAGLLFVGTDDGIVLFSDPGASGRWLRIGHELRNHHIGAVWPLFENPQIILAGGTDGLWRSTNGGATWQQNAEFQVIAFTGRKETPQDVSLLMLSGDWQHSDDGGSTWHATAPMPATIHEPLHVELPGQAPVLLVAQGNAILRSEDAGITDTVTSIDLAWSGDVSILAPARYHIDTAFAGSTSGQLAVSTDRGRTWRMLKQDLPPVRSIVATRLI